MPARSHGDGHFDLGSFARLGQGVVFEPGVLVFHPEQIEIGDDVYVGHQTILKGYYRGRLTIGSGTWIGQLCFLHAGGNLTIGRDVGIGPGVKIVTSSHRLDSTAVPILRAPLDFAPVVIEEGADIGVGAIVLPGVTIGARAQVGAGAVVTRDVAPLAIVAGNPARELRRRAAP
ncbi:MAG: acyltransferase [Proteobacteria bacterium]|nr:acyltransferase [Pseudomonadota bacterium]